MAVRTQFRCWRCKQVLKALLGDAHAVFHQERCPACGALSVLDYAFPRAEVEVVGEPDAPPASVPAPEVRGIPDSEEGD